MLKVNALGSTTGPIIANPFSPTALCAPLAQVSAGLTQGMRGGNVVALQTFLMQNGGSIGYGATGYFGAQTQAALFFVKGVNHCN